MKLDEIVSVVFKLGDWINTLWNVHLIVSIALLGWMFSAKQSWGCWSKLCLAVTYLAFAGVNLWTQAQAHDALGFVLLELNAVASRDGSQLSTPLLTYLKTMKDLHIVQPWVTFALHGFASAVVLLAILLHRAPTPPKGEGV